MKIDECQQYLFKVFKLNEEILDEFGFTSRVCNDINVVGYATNLTPEVINKAVRQRVDLIITHHDAWDFIFGMKDYCLRQLYDNKISHVFSHSPLDIADLGPANALIEQLQGKGISFSSIEKGAPYKDGFAGRTGVLEKPLALKTLVNLLQTVCGERVLHWQNNKRLVKRIGIIPGGGQLTTYIKELVLSHFKWVTYL